MLIFLAFSVTIAAATWMTPIDFDSAFNLQVSQSLQENFTYQTRYVPAKIYNEKITTNGPIQYCMAAMIGGFGLDLGRSITLGLIAGLAALSIFLYSRLSFAFYGLLLGIWPRFALSHTLFLGEVFAISLVMTGITLWEHGIAKFLDHGHLRGTEVLRRIAHSPHFWLSGLAFGAAIATKLMAAPVILCLLLYLGSTNKKIVLPSRWRLVNLWVILAYSLAQAVFVLQFAASILHSGGAASSIWPTLTSFVVSHGQQTETAASLHGARWLPSPELVPILALYIGLFVVLSRWYKFFAASGLSCAAILLEGHLDLRRILPLIVPIMLIAIKESQTGCPLAGAANHRSPTFRKTAIAVLPLIGTWCWVGMPLSLVDVLRQFSVHGAAHNVASLSRTKVSAYSPQLIPMIAGLTRPIATSGWWQFPEISLRTGSVFYDRFASENLMPLKQATTHFLLFSTEVPEDRTTEQDLCGPILYRNEPLILCQARPE